MADQYDKDYAARPENIKKRAERVKARRLMEKKYGKQALKGKDVDHKKALKDGGSTTLSNLRLMSPAKNRGRNNRG